MTESVHKKESQEGIADASVLLAGGVRDGDWNLCLDLLNQGVLPGTRVGLLQLATRFHNNLVSELRKQKLVISKLAMSTNLNDILLNDIDVGLKEILIEDLNRKKSVRSAKESMLINARKELAEAQKASKANTAILVETFDDYKRFLVENDVKSANDADKRRKQAENEEISITSRLNRAKKDLEVAEKIYNEPDKEPENTIRFSWSTDGNELLRQLSTSNINADAIYLLKAEGCDLDSPDVDGRTPLMLSAIFGAFTMTISLLDNGANPDYKDNLGLELLDFLSDRKLSEDILKAYQAIEVIDQATTSPDVINWLWKK